jgi:signal transduction histidine kinase
VALGTLLTRPLRRITAVAERIADGDASASGDLELERRDEVGRLASAFDRMLRRLFGQQQRIDALNADLEKRLGELGETNAALADRIEELRRTQAQLIVSDRRSSVGTLAAGVAHEINNPLTFVVANVDFLAENMPAGVSADVKSALAEAKEGARRVQHIVRSLKTFSRTGERDERVALDLVGPLDAALHMASSEIRQRARLVRELRPVPCVLGSEVQLGQVFLNLLVNAAQAIAPGAVGNNQVRVSSWTDDDGSAVVEVSDTGCGMSEETRARLFVPFFTTKAVGAGTGLGLSIAQGIVHAHGGKITVESEPGRGTSFRVILPAARGKKPSSHPRLLALVQPPVRRGQILVIDDEPMVCRTVHRLLPQHEVVMTVDVLEALALLRAGRRFDLILCDLMMPVMTGAEFEDEARRIDPAQAERTWFITGGAFTDAARAFLLANEQRTLEKPLTKPKLEEVVRAHLD